MISQQNHGTRIQLTGSRKLTDALEVLVEGRENADHIAAEARRAGFTAVVPDQELGSIATHHYRVTIVPCAGSDLQSVEKFLSDHPGFELTVSPSALA